MAIECDRTAVTPFPALSLLDSPACSARSRRAGRARNAGPSAGCRRCAVIPRTTKCASDISPPTFAITPSRRSPRSCSSGTIARVSSSPPSPWARMCATSCAHGWRSRSTASFPWRDKSDAQVAALARSLEIDIAVDLGGYTQHARPRILALRAAPVQVSYLGFLGTMGGGLHRLPARRRESSCRASCGGITPRESPICRAIRPTIPEDPCRTGCSPAPSSDCRQAASCSAASTQLQDQPGDLRELDANPRRSARQHAAASRRQRGRAPQSAAGGEPRAGVDPARLVFAGRVPYGDYLARYRAADLFLDTLPYNAGTTASDALWAGLPVLTCAGDSFAARMGASLLTAVGLPELITCDRPGYERLAIELAQQPDRLAGDSRQADRDARRPRPFSTRRASPATSKRSTCGCINGSVWVFCPSTCSSSPESATAG